MLKKALHEDLIQKQTDKHYEGTDQFVIFQKQASHQDFPCFVCFYCQFQWPAKHHCLAKNSAQNLYNFIHYLFEKTKNLIIGLTHHLDKTEEVYNIFLKEHKKRNG